MPTPSDWLIDREEALRDAVLLAIDDQLCAGLGLAREDRQFSEGATPRVLRRGER